MSLSSTFVQGFHNIDDVQKMKYHDFGQTGMKISKLSLGTGGFSQLYGDFTLEQCKQTVIQGLKSGINYIDTAPWYGQGVSETTLGKCLDGVPRAAYYIATKVGRYEKDPKKMFDFSAERTRQSIETSLKKLNVDYVDVLQIHDVEFGPSIDYIIKETLPVLIEAKKHGKARFIGVTGYPVIKLAEFASKTNEIDMILSYSRLTIIDQELLNYKYNFKNLGVVNAAVLSMGLLTSEGPQEWHPAHQPIKDACKTASDYCKTKGVNIAKLALSFAFDNSFGDTVLSGMNSPELLQSSLKVLHEGLKPQEKETLEYIQQQFFSPLAGRNWEGVEMATYQKLLAQ